MTIIQGALMGIVQGLTEFLPVSSSGHLALARHILGAGEAQDVAFEVAVHAGTLVAVVIFFWGRILDLLSDAARGKGEGRRWLLYVVIATIPAGVVGLTIKDSVEALFNNIALVGAAWIFTAIVLLAAERWATSRVEAGVMGVWRALAIGVAQAVAILPGVSRSGSTISAGLLVGVERKQSVGFSFILSLPVVAGAIVLTLKDWEEGAVTLGMPHLVGALTALISGYLAIALMLRVVEARKMKWFAYYCLILGVVTLWYSIF